MVCNLKNCFYKLRIVSQYSVGRAESIRPQKVIIELGNRGMGNVKKEMLKNSSSSRTNHHRLLNDSIHYSAKFDLQRGKGMKEIENKIARLSPIR